MRTLLLANNPLQRINARERLTLLEIIAYGETNPQIHALPPPKISV